MAQNTTVTQRPYTAAENDNASNTQDALFYFALTVCAVVFVLGVFGNLLVLIVFGRRYKKLKTFEALILSLGVADLIGAIVMPWANILSTLKLQFLPVSIAGCKIFAHFSMVSLIVSALTLMMMASERYIIIKWPLRKYLTMRKVCCLLVLSWLIGNSFGLFYVVGDHIKIRLHTGSCSISFSRKEMLVYSYAALLIQIFIPMVSVATLYILIIHELRKSLSNPVLQDNARALNLHLERNRKASHMVVVVVVLFYVSVIPANLFFLLHLYGQHKRLSQKQLHYVITILDMLQMVNSCTNPLIYSKLHTTFKRTARSLICSYCPANLYQDRQQIESRGMNAVALKPVQGNTVLQENA